MPVLDYSAGQSSHASAGTRPLIAGFVATYLGVILLALWVSLAIEHFKRVEGQNVLYGTPRWPHYLRWRGDVQAWVGVAWVLAITTLSIAAMARRRARPWQFVVCVLGNLAGVIVLGVLVETIGFGAGLLP